MSSIMPLEGVILSRNKVRATQMDMEITLLYTHAYVDLTKGFWRQIDLDNI